MTIKSVPFGTRNKASGGFLFLMWWVLSTTKMTMRRTVTTGSILKPNYVRNKTSWLVPLPN